LSTSENAENKSYRERPEAPARCEAGESSVEIGRSYDVESLDDQQAGAGDDYAARTGCVSRSRNITACAHSSASVSL
jgi:hypothetical protein